MTDTIKKIEDLRSEALKRCAKRIAEAKKNPDTPREEKEESGITAILKRQRGL
jgi:hypothetical protein